MELNASIFMSFYCFRRGIMAFGTKLLKLHFGY